MSNEIAAQVFCVGVHAVGEGSEGDYRAEVGRHELEAELKEDRNPYVIRSVSEHRNRISKI